MNAKLYEQIDASAKVLSFGDLAQRKNNSGSQTRKFFCGRYLPFTRALSQTIEWSSGELSYSRVDGQLVNAAASADNNVIVGLSISGRSRLFNGRAVYSLNPGEATLILPGDIAILEMVDSRHYSLKIPLPEPVLFQIMGIPHRNRLECGGLLNPILSRDFAALFEFMWQESMKSHDRAATNRDQIEAIGCAIRVRTNIQLQQLLNFSEPSDLHLLQICRNSERYISSNLSAKITTKSMADAANCSVRHLHRAFDTIISMTPVSFLIRVRLHRARSYIVSNAIQNLTMSSVAIVHGFPSLNSFFQAYHQEFGELPLDTEQSTLSALTGHFAVEV